MIAYFLGSQWKSLVLRVQTFLEYICDIHTPVKSGIQLCPLGNLTEPYPTLALSQTLSNIIDKVLFYAQVG